MRRPSRGVTVALAAVAVVAVADWRLFSSTQVTVRVLEHKPNLGGGYVLLYRVLSPNDLAGRYGVGATLRSALPVTIDGSDYRVGLNPTMVGTLTTNRSIDYAESPPADTRDDFLESAVLVQ